MDIRVFCFVLLFIMYVSHFSVSWTKIGFVVLLTLNSGRCLMCVCVCVVCMHGARFQESKPRVELQHSIFYILLCERDMSVVLSVYLRSLERPNSLEHDGAWLVFCVTTTLDRVRRAGRLSVLQQSRLPEVSRPSL